MWRIGCTCGKCTVLECGAKAPSIFDVTLRHIVLQWWWYSPQESELLMCKHWVYLCKLNFKYRKCRVQMWFTLARDIIPPWLPYSLAWIVRMQLIRVRRAIKALCAYLVDQVIIFTLGPLPGIFPPCSFHSFCSLDLANRVIPAFIFCWSSALDIWKAGAAGITAFTATWRGT